MSQYNNHENKIRRRKVSSSTSSTSSSNINRNKVARQDLYDTKDRENTNKSKKVNTRDDKSVKKSKKKNNKLKKLIKPMMVLALSLLIFISGIGSVFIFSALKGSEEVTKSLLESRYLASEFVRKEEIPKYLKDAVVSIEDERFYEHNGVDTISLVRSFIHNLLTDTTQGGSTIEMQISKNLLTSDDKTIKRKIKDIYNATSMNKNMNKDDILEIYLNNIYLGKSSYGVAKGAIAYFGKSVSELSLAECAMLAGITNNPAKYSEFSQAKKRQETILYKMNELGYINDIEYKNALAEKIAFKSEIQ